MAINRINKKGLFFIIDALLASAIILGGLLLITSNYVSRQPNVHLNYLSQDLINSLSNYHLYEINNSYVQELIDNGNITNTDNTIIEQAGEFWAEGKNSIVYAFLGNITEGILPDNYGYGIWMDKEVLYKKDSPPPYSRSSSRKLISGIGKALPIKGYISRAMATTYSQNSTLIIPFYTAGAGWYGSQTNPGEVVIDKYFEMNNVSVTNATFYISVHIQSGGPNYEIINFNNGTCIFYKDDLNFIGGDGTFDTRQVTGCLVSGTNHIQLKLQNLGYNAHIHPGMLLKVNYFLNGSLPFYENQFSKRYYFDNVVSYEGSNKLSGAWQMVPFFIPEDATNISAAINIHGKNIRDYTGNLRFDSWDGKKYARDYDYILFLNENSPFDYDNHPPMNPQYNYSGAQVNSRLVEGTNIISVYFNNYGDQAWGGGMPQIYSDPINDPENSSYIEVNYSLERVAPYGHIPFTQVQEFGGAAHWQKETSFSFPEGAGMMGNVFAHIVQQYSYMVDVDADTYTPPLNRVFSSPSARAVPTAVYIPKNVLDLSPNANNYIRITDRARNDLLPYTAVEYTFYIPSMIGYGRVFSTQAEAEEDALNRLSDLLGDFISGDNIILESSQMNDVPTMWGPAVVEVRVWH